MKWNRKQAQLILKLLGILEGMTKGTPIHPKDCEVLVNKMEKVLKTFKKSYKFYKTVHEREGD